MAIIVAQTNGNFSSPSTWFDGVVPTVDDLVYTNTFTVTIDQDINVGRLSNNSVSPARTNPSMNSNTSPSGVASASSNGASAWVAFDGSNSGTGNSWVATDGTGGTGWVAYQFSVTRRIVRYQILFSVDTTNTNQNPTAWQFQGSDDGVTWTTIDTVTGFTPGVGTNYDSGTVTNPNTYLRYRINVTAAGAGATRIRIGEISFWEFGGQRNASLGGQFQITTPRNITLTTTTPIGHGQNQAPIVVNNSTGTTTFNISNAMAGTFISGLISHIGAGTLTINCPNMGASASNNGTTISRSGNGTININGNLLGATSGSSNVTFVNSGSGTINIVGNIISGNSNNTSQVITSSNGDMTITGNVDGGTSAGTTGILITAGTLIVNGTVTGSAQNAINNQSICTINGNVLSTGAGAGLISTVAATSNVIGNATASASANAIYCSSSGHVLNFTGNIINSGQRQAICSTTIRLSDSLPSFWQASTVTNAAKIFYTADTFPNTPAIGNVRQGTTYGPGSSLTGTLAVPLPSNVLSGVPTDNTVGTYSTTPSQIATEIFTKLLSNTDFNTVGSFGKLVKDNLDATVSSRSTQTSVDAIPTNPLLTTDSRLNNLDATISSRLASASYTAPDNTTIGTINTKLGTPVSSVSADIASVKSDSSGLRTDYTTGRAANLDNLDATVSSRATQTSVNAIPTNPLLTTDSRLNNLDATISSRSTQTSVDAIPTNPLLTTDSRLNNLDATISSRATQTTADAIKNNTDLIPAAI